MKLKLSLRNVKILLFFFPIINFSASHNKFLEFYGLIT